MWSVEFASAIALAEVEALPSELRARFLRISDMIESYGLEKMREPYVKHLEGKLWEIRLKGKMGIARSLYVTAIGRRVVIVRTFVKKTQETPRREMEIAFARAKEVR
jgi:phage-related protein